jgi:hypothetical protein
VACEKVYTLKKEAIACNKRITIKIFTTVNLSFIINNASCAFFPKTKKGLFKANSVKPVKK